ncbi:MAG TPA: VOC family protein [Acidimicrobiia bacterium]|nr:VOC family protein [Acidimicrobiia bacterium]
MDLDHVALATRDVRDALVVLVGELGGIVLFGGESVGFRPMQLRLGDADAGMNIELLEPWVPERNDFLERFVARHGPGPHHLTYKVDDLATTLDRVRTAGYQPVNVDLSDPDWKEAFLHPREAHGTVVQLAEARGDWGTLAQQIEQVRREGAHGHPRWWPDPPPPGDRAAVLRRVVIATPSLTATLGFFAGLLQGDEAAGGEGWVELAWPGGGRVKLEDRPGRPPRVDRLEADVEGDGPLGERTVAGTRLLLEPR